MLEMILLAVPAMWYATGVRALWRAAGRGHGVTGLRVVSFAGGIATLAIALLSPIDELADALFSAHMVQHLLLIMVAAPLWVLGNPLLPMLFALPCDIRHGLGRWWMRNASLRRSVHFITTPGVVLVAHMGALWFWHFPVPYQAALGNASLHAAEHLSFFLTALLFWWVVVTPMGRRRASEPAAIFMVVGTLMQSGVLGAMLMLARAPWYPAHGPATRAWGRTLLEDQQLAGLLMWIPGTVVYVTAAAVLFVAWMRRDERGAGRSGERLDAKGESPAGVFPMGGTA